MDNPRVALVTGSSRGIGREIALRLADAPEIAAVAVHYHQDKVAAGDVANAIKSKGKGSAAFRADLLAEDQAMSLVGQVEKEFGRVDILVNDFGPFITKDWQALTGEDWDGILKGALLSAFHCLKAALPGMRTRQWGRIINIGYSRAEQLASFPGILPYAVAKTGLLTVTRTVAVSEVASGVTVNMVSPGLMKGGALPKSKTITEKSIGDFKDVAEAVFFLASDRAAAITGTNLIVAGSWKM
jgi:3-oxoacyl-[acyl-carrier protein] reductase